ncbi:MAG: L,D-transpeptidase [Aestuariivirga sp.]
MRDTDESFRIANDDVRKVRRKYRRREVSLSISEPPGTIIVDPASKYLYFTLGGGRAIRYGVGVGRQGFEWSGQAVIRRKAKWPRWTPPKDMVERDPLAKKWAKGMPGGPNNPLGARALYLFQGNVDTLYRIHGTFQPSTIGSAVSSGCIRMINADVADLYERVRIGAKVVVRNTPIEVVEEEPRRRWPFFNRNR